MQQQAAAGDFRGAMQTFDVLEKEYGTTRGYPAAVSWLRKCCRVCNSNWPAGRRESWRTRRD